jgi:hypothetical protein
MTVSLTYDSTLARVIINTDGLGAAVTATVERSVDGVQWTTIRGGTNAPIVSGVLAPFLSDYEFIPNVVNTYRVTPNTGSVQSNTITPTLTEVWLKSLRRPFLNMPFKQAEIVSDIGRSARQGIFDVIGRSLPIAVTDLRQSREYTFRCVTRTKAEADSFDMLAASGDVLFIHAPPSGHISSAYVTARNVQQSLRIPEEWCVWSLDMREVAAPSADVIGSTATYQTVLNAYATYTDLLAAHTDYSDVLLLLADSSEVIVP